MRFKRSRVFRYTVLFAAIGGICWLVNVRAMAAFQRALNRQLVNAARCEDVSEVQRLLRQGADPNAEGVYDESIYPGLKGKPKPDPTLRETLTEVILGKKAGQKEAGSNARSLPVLHIAMGGDAYIIDGYASYDSHSVHLNKKTHRVEASRAQEEIVRALVEAGADVNARTSNGGTPLSAAIMTANRGAVALLLERGANVNALDRHGSSPLDDAVSMHNENVIRALIRRGANVNAQAEEGYAPFMVNEYTTIGTMKALLEAHPNLGLRNDKGETALTQARRLRKTAIVRLLVQAGATE